MVADHSRLSLLPPPGAEPAAGSDPAALLDRFCQPEGALWWARNDTLLFQKRDWFFRRQYEVPDRWLDATIHALKTSGEQATLRDLLRLEELTRRQQIGLHGLAARFGSMPRAFRRYEEREAGLPELLALLKGRRSATAWGRFRLLNPRAMEPVEARNRAYEAMSIKFDVLRPDQRALLLPFLAMQPKEFDGLQLETFQVTVMAGEPTSHKRTHRSLPLEIEWGMRGGGGDYEYLFLPLEIPDDRRSRTLVTRSDQVKPGD